MLRPKLNQPFTVSGLPPAGGQSLSAEQYSWAHEDHDAQSMRLFIQKGETRGVEHAQFSSPPNSPFGRAFTDREKK